MPNWIWNRKLNEEEVQTSPAEESSSSGLSDLEIEKKWLQLSRIDSREFEFFYRKYYDSIMIFISGEIKTPEVAQEITNEVFSVALDKLDKFRWQGFSFGAWLFQIARNLVAEEGRRLGRSPEVPWIHGKTDAEDPVLTDDALHQSDDDRILAGCLEKLDQERRQIFWAHYWLRLKVRDIAVIMEMSESNVKNHLQRGRSQLLRWLMENGLERELSAEKMKLIKEVTVREEGWGLIGGEGSESS
jgi:RNA polymerase sigma factor (sigma-70 family)